MGRTSLIRLIRLSESMRMRRGDGARRLTHKWQCDLKSNNDRDAACRISLCAHNLLAAGNAASRVSTEDLLVRTGRRSSRGRLLLNGQQLDTAPRTSAA